MIITNTHNMPEVLVRKCSTEKHNKPHCVSATTLKSGTRAYWLTERHWDEITQDVINMIWALFGTTAHSLLEEPDKDTFVEKAVEKEYKGWKITGKVDGYNTKTYELYDWKTTSVWKFVYQSFDDWHYQGMVYAYLLKDNGLECNKCKFIGLLKDHSDSDYEQKGGNYPQYPVETYEFDVTEEELKIIEEKMFSKMDEIIANENTPDDELPLCSEEERWYKSEFKVYKNENSKRAEKNFNDKNNPGTSTEEKRKLAEEFAASIGGIVKDASTDGKCSKYCVCHEFCSYWREHYSK